MQIIKILNNNVVISEDNKEEVVLMGRGLAFGRKVGQEIPDELIENKYVLSENRRQLLMELPAEVMKMSDKIISFAREKLQKKLKDTAFLAMADHIHGVLLRSEDDIYLKNFLMWDIKRFFPIEFEVGQYAKQLLSAYIGKELPDDETAFMTLTLINAELENGDGAARDLTMMMEEIMAVVKYSLEISLDEEDIYLERFMTHLKFFCERVLTNSGNRDLEDNEMFDLLKCKYPLAYETTRKIAEFLKQTRNYQTSEDEQLYLTIHLSRMKRRMPCEANTKK